MIDLHLHTTASDGHCTPAELVERVRAAAIRTLSVTDHDTMAAVPEVAELAAAHGLEAMPGIEITSVWGQTDVHVLGYFLDPDPPGLAEFLSAQREHRIARLVEIGSQLADLGMPIDVDALMRRGRAEPGRSLGRPLVAQALVTAGHVATVREAFTRLIGEGGPAFVPRRGAPPAQVVGRIARAGGVASLAHPGLLGRDELIPELAAAGLGAIEAYHSEHDPRAQARYVRMARDHGLAVSGGSDFHGSGDHRAGALGVINLPEEEFARLRDRAVRAQAALTREHAPDKEPPRP